MKSRIKQQHIVTLSAVAVLVMLLPSIVTANLSIYSYYVPLGMIIVLIVALLAAKRSLRTIIPAVFIYGFNAYILITIYNFAMLDCGPDPRDCSGTTGEEITLKIMLVIMLAAIAAIVYQSAPKTSSVTASHKQSPRSKNR